MPQFDVISGQSSVVASKAEADRIDFVLAIRVLLWTSLLIFSVVFQFSQPQFIGLEIWLAVMVALGVQLGLNAGVLLSNSVSETEDAIWLFGADLVCATALVYATGGHESVLTLLYSVIVILAGMSLPRDQAFLMALGAASLYNILIVLSPQVGLQSLGFSIAINNASFFALSYLSGELGGQIRSLGLELTESRRDVAALKDLNSLVFENIGTGLLVTNPFGMLVYANEAAERILDRKDLTQHNLNFVFQEINQAVDAGEVPKEQGEVVRFDLIYKTPRGEKLNIEALVSHLFDHDRPRGLLILIQDLTLIKNFEQQMRQREKLAAVGQLAAGIAHEIRNPLASISGSIQLLTATSDGLNQEDRKLMSIVLKEIDRLNGLISEFLDYVRPEVRVNVPVDINQILREVLDMVRLNRQLNSQVQVETQLRAAQTVTGHKDKLKQAFLNIIINSYQAMDKMDRGSLSVSTVDDVGRVVVTITDSGVGIDPENLSRIFEPFHTTKAQGTGLGLAVTHKILESHEAKVYVESEVGVGTKFRVEFPTERDRFEGEAPRLKEA